MGTWMRFRRWLSDWWFVLHAPPMIGSAEDFRVLIEVLPCPGLDVERPTVEVEALGRGFVEDAHTHETQDDGVPTMEILSAGTPVYVRSKNLFLVRGKIVKPLRFAVLREKNPATHPTDTPDPAETLHCDYGKGPLAGH